MKKRAAAIQTAVTIGVCQLSASVARAEDNLGTAMGLPNSSPSIQWPRGFSLESLGTGRLYPNGPEFGLSTTAGGFGSSGTARISGAGLAERSVAGLAGSEFKPFSEIRTLSDAFSLERQRSSLLFGAALGRQFRTEMQRLPEDISTGSSSGALFRLLPLPSVDAVLGDKPASTDSVLRTNF